MRWDVMYQWAWYIFQVHSLIVSNFLGSSSVAILYHGIV